jgi:prepilin-type N-terminal cleavage/methylation domain-containing protein
MKTRQAFSMIEMLFVMIIMGSLASIALPSYASNIKAKIVKKLSENLDSNYELTKRFMSKGYLAPVIDFTATADDKTYSVEDSDGNLYNYNLGFSNFRFVQVDIYDPSTEDENGSNGIYSGVGIIMSSPAFDKCRVFNDIEDSEPTWSTVCDPDSLNWDYQD